MNEPTPLLEIRGLTRKGQELWVEHQFENPTDKTVFVFNMLSDHSKLLDPPPRLVVSPEVAQSCLREPDILHILHGLPAQPNDPDIDLYAALTPQASKVKPGGRYLATVRVPLPAREWDLYHDPVSDGPRVRRLPVTRVRLSVDWVFEPDSFYAEENRKYPGAFAVNGHPICRLWAEAVLPEPLDLLAREDFPRFWELDI